MIPIYPKKQKLLGQVTLIVFKKTQYLFLTFMYIDENFLYNHKNFLYKSTKNIAKKILNKALSKNYMLNEQKLITHISAESKQAISTINRKLILKLKVNILIFLQLEMKSMII